MHIKRRGEAKACPQRTASSCARSTCGGTRSLWRRRTVGHRDSNVGRGLRGLCRAPPASVAFSKLPTCALGLSRCVFKSARLKRQGPAEIVAGTAGTYRALRGAGTFLAVHPTALARLSRLSPGSSRRHFLGFSHTDPVHVLLDSRHFNIAE